MELEYRIRMLETIEDYVRGRLNQDEIELLWIEMLKEPEWFRYLKTYANFLYLAYQNKENMKQSMKG